MPDFDPQPGPQTAFLRSSADIAIFGGAAGGGKSYALLLEAVRHIDKPGYGAVIFRRTLADVKKEGGLWDTSIPIYGNLRAAPRLDNFSWTFPSPSRLGGGKITFAGLEHDKDVLKWQGSQIPMIGFDELTHFSRVQFFYMLSRNRTTNKNVRPYIRATCNPDADSWVAEFISYWIDPVTGYAIPERSGVIRWFAKVGDATVWGDSEEELQVNYPGCEALSATFVPSLLSDNKILMEADPGYRKKLMGMDRVERERLLNGNWKIRPSSGLYFQRNWCEVVETIPAGTKFVRGWDLAATPKTPQNDPDWTCGTKIGRCPDGRFIVVDHVFLQGAPLRVEGAVKAAAKEDGRETRIHIPQDPAAAGKAQVEVYRNLLAGFNVRFAIASGDKITRFSGFSAQADPGNGQYGNVIVLKRPWNDRWFAQLESFPEATHDDDVDSTSEAFNGLIGKFGPGEALLEMLRAQGGMTPAVEKKSDDSKLITYAPGSVEYAAIMENEND